jgi:hypothetical protein
LQDIVLRGMEVGDGVLAEVDPGKNKGVGALAACEVIARAPINSSLPAAPFNVSDPNPPLSRSL